MAVQGGSMILTFSLLGRYFNSKLVVWFGHIWGGALVLGGIAVVLACVVIFVLLKSSGRATSAPTMDVNLFNPKILMLALS